jgi:hypothetical protein
MIFQHPLAAGPQDSGQLPLTQPALFATIRQHWQNKRLEQAPDIPMQLPAPLKDPAMSWKQLFLLILTIWTAEIFTRLLFDALVTPRMEYMTYYLEIDKDGDFRGSNIMPDVGARGWQMVSAVPNPENSEELLLVFQRRVLF